MIPLNILVQVKSTLANKNLLFLFLLSLTPFIYIESLFDKVDLPRFAYVSLIAIFWFITWLISVNNKKISINWNPLFYIILFLLLFASISYLWGKENTLYQKELYFYTGLVMICFMGMQLNAKTIHQFSSLIVITASVCAVIGVLQNFNLNVFNFKQIAPPAATFINKNFAANFFDLILPISITLFIVSKNKKEAWIFALTITMIISYMIMTKSRGTYLAIIVTLSFLLISIQLFPLLKKQTKLSSRLYKKQIFFIIIISFLLLSLPKINFQPKFEENRYSNFFSGKQKNSQNTISLRLNAYQNSLDLLKENPIVGVGLGGFQFHFRLYTQSILAKNKIISDFIYLHNDLLQLFIELGIIGGATVLLFFLLLFRFSFSNLNHMLLNGSDIKTNILYIGFFIAIIASMSHSFFSFPYHQPTSATIMALWVGFLLNLTAKQVSFSNSKKQQISRILMLSFSILLLIGVSQFYYKFIRSSIYMNQSVKANKINDCNKASELAILSNDTYAKDYLSQTQGINIIASCPLKTKTQLLFAENVLKNNPTHPRALYLASISYFKLGNYKSSSKHLKLLTFIYPYFTNSYIFLGHIAVKQKDYKKAKSYYNHTLKLSPNNKVAQNLLGQIMEKGY